MLMNFFYEFFIVFWRFLHCHKIGNIFQKICPSDDQLIQWWGEEDKRGEKFAGIIIFYEWHWAKNLAPPDSTSSSKSGEKSKRDSREEHPNTRIPYVSATEWVLQTHAMSSYTSFHAFYFLFLFYDFHERYKKLAHFCRLLVEALGVF